MKEQSAKAQEPASSVVQLHVVHMCTKPDALYMLEDKMYAASPPSSSSSVQQLLHWSAGYPSTTVDIIAGTVPGRLRLPVIH